ncbi:hypothetical protein OV203_08725 [Nannocystis sp. ILAH1]|uniref:hypothetical protein n=1 Tax=Nannocystis sp. ILAH1 TaxID=2996789 RepID=UPI002270E71C|nr:hypothetical protein [Nannocystis sp. ILAH1]MCY0987204.1 hypothetical protein [Nannocystis sp. ILAH1]
MDLREHGRQPHWRRRRHGQEAHVSAELLEGVSDEAVQIHVEAEVAAESLDHREHPGGKRPYRAQPVTLFDGPPHIVHHRSREALSDFRQEHLVVAQTHCQRSLEGEDPLPVADRWQHVVAQQRRSFRHPPTHARRAESPALTRKRYEQLVATLAARRPHEALLEVAALRERFELRIDELR